MALGLEEESEISERDPIGQESATGEEEDDEPLEGEAGKILHRHIIRLPKAPPQNQIRLRPIGRPAVTAPKGQNPEEAKPTKITTQEKKEKRGG